MCHRTVQLVASAPQSGVWSIFRLIRAALKSQPKTENMDLTPLTLDDCAA
jgi:hypothetical protein